jgi:SOS-response transcriptional repressor LexA
MSKLTELTDRQKQIYDFIQARVESHGHGPTVREIGDAFHIRSPWGVMCHLTILVRKGLISKTGKEFPSGTPPTSSEVAQHIRHQFVSLQERVNALEQQKAEANDREQVREGFITELMEQKRCPDCQRQLKDWW